MRMKAFDRILNATATPGNALRSGFSLVSHVCPAGRADQMPEFAFTHELEPVQTGSSQAQAAAAAASAASAASRFAGYNTLSWL